jgi:hypothetical protein
LNNNYNNDFYMFMMYAKIPHGNAIAYANWKSASLLWILTLIMISHSLATNLKKEKNKDYQSHANSWIIRLWDIEKD